VQSTGVLFLLLNFFSVPPVFVFTLPAVSFLRFNRLLSSIFKVPVASRVKVPISLGTESVVGSGKVLTVGTLSVSDFVYKVCTCS
jgi:hypothetical protein